VRVSLGECTNPQSATTAGAARQPIAYRRCGVCAPSSHRKCAGALSVLYVYLPPVVASITAPVRSHADGVRYGATCAKRMVWCSRCVGGTLRAQDRPRSELSDLSI
jgi:hypothetical protein